MRLGAWLVVVVVGGIGSGCGGKPALANAPHPPAGAVAGVAAAAAAALTLADPDAATRKPEKRKVAPAHAVEVKEHVPSDVLDRLDHAEAIPTDAGVPEVSADASPDAGPSATPTAAPDARPAGRGTHPRIPSPREAVDHDPAAPRPDR